MARPAARVIAPPTALSQEPEQHSGNSADDETEAKAGNIVRNGACRARWRWRAFRKLIAASMPSSRVWMAARNRDGSILWAAQLKAALFSRSSISRFPTPLVNMTPVARFAKPAYCMANPKKTTSGGGWKGLCGGRCLGRERETARWAARGGLGGRLDLSQGRAARGPCNLAAGVTHVTYQSLIVGGACSKGIAYVSFWGMGEADCDIGVSLYRHNIYRLSLD